MLSRIFLIAAIVIGIPFLARADERAQGLADFPVVSTLAGSGGLGIADGPADAATFVSPAGLSYASDGTLFVADRSAQRIRAVSPAGVVRTIAGSGALVPLGIGAPGGFRDGPAALALFDMPAAVLAMDDGSVLVADTNNYCVRRIRNGSVSTFAGDRVRGARDGAGAGAEFSLPVAFAKDGAGNAYVADPPNGVRKIDPSGRVTTLKFAGSSAVVAVATSRDDIGGLLVASVSHVEHLNVRTLAVDRPFPLQLTFDFGAPAGELVIHEGNSNFGPVAALAAFGRADFVFADALASAVRFAQTAVSGKITFDYSRTLTAIPREDAALGIAGFRDGPGAQALVSEPTGIAISPSGSVAVADTGNRRIRLLTAFDHRTHLQALDLGTELPAKPDRREYRIAIVGNSYVWWNQSWHHSIAGMTEDRLANRLGGARHAVVLPIMREGVTSLASLDLIGGELSEGVVDMVVLDLSTYGQMGGDGFAGPAFLPGWDAALIAALSRTAKTLAAAGIAFLVVNHPGAPDFPGEFEYARVYKGPGGPDVAYPNEASNVQLFHDAIARTVAAASVPTLDLWAPFLDAYAASERVPLFNAWDHHLSPAGQELVAGRLADRILEMKPWANSAAVRRRL